MYTDKLEPNRQSSYVDVELSDILADHEFNTRIEKPDATNVAELIESIKTSGLIQPIVLRTINHETKKYVIVSGYRRFTALQALKYERVSCMVHYNMTSDEAAVINFIENNERKNLTLLEEAKILKRFISYGLNRQEIQKKLKVSYQWYQTRRNILDLPEQVQQMIGRNELSQQQINDLAFTYTYNKERGKDLTDEVIRSAARMRDKTYNNNETFVNPVNISKSTVSDDKDAASKTVAGRTFKTDEAIDLMVQELIRLFDTNLGSRALAWVQCHISTAELLEDVKRECSYIGINYEPSDAVKGI